MITDSAGTPPAPPTSRRLRRASTWLSCPRPTVLDFNGDGMSDVVFANQHGHDALPTSRWAYTLSTGVKPDLLTGVDNGIGGTLTVAYKPRSHFPNAIAPAGGCIAWDAAQGAAAPRGERSSLWRREPGGPTGSSSE